MENEISVFRDHAEHRRNSIESLFDFTRALINTLLEAQQSHHLHSDDWARTIYIDTLGVQTTDFNLSDETKKKLIKSGKEGALNYFSWFDNEVKKRAS
ncbi:NTE family protein [Azotobacter beijerinckii]|uniref:NTE family protein n=1 Tax=Azotobacter beijerinckii TaxID=170623 RepID=A0A1H9PC93_9GAMM|nr:NTE family protein [Azotobacter beijerinckii]